MKPFLLTYLTLLLIGLAITLASLIWCGHLASGTRFTANQESHAHSTQELNYQVLPASTACPVNSCTAHRNPGNTGCHLTLYTRVETDPQGHPVLRGYRLRLTWDAPPTTSRGVSGTPLPERDMAAPF